MSYMPLSHGKTKDVAKISWFPELRDRSGCGLRAFPSREKEAGVESNREKDRGMACWQLETNQSCSVLVMLEAWGRTGAWRVGSWKLINPVRYWSCWRPGEGQGHGVLAVGN
ncbi:hypothetical protein RRG08_059440 [Elysia crispata]|uniref:Uncharacterized protein n=1 Tax=Elysia crispata TaxID=231223 RepID=A0AAE1DRX5_9GAST|nr:hypothetical protein RRG08_059440 [Elysia crispata]